MVKLSTVPVAVTNDWTDPCVCAYVFVGLYKNIY